MNEQHGLDELLAAHQQVSTLSDACTCGAGDLDTLQPSGIALQRHRTHVARVIEVSLRAEIAAAIKGLHRITVTNQQDELIDHAVRLAEGDVA